MSDLEIKEQMTFTKIDNVDYKIKTIEPINYQYGTSYIFDIGYAQKYGLEESIFLNNLIFWLKQNKANNNNFKDGKYWTYNTQKSYSKLFPFWTESQIKRIIKSLVDQNVIIIGHYNEDKYDHTNWYALIDESMIFNPPIDKTISSNREDNNVLSNRDNRTFINTDVNTNINSDVNTNIYIDDCKEILLYLNEKCKKSFKLIENNYKHITSRLNQGFTKDDCKKVINIKSSQWLNTDYEQYLRPQTLFSTKFESYLNQKNIFNNQSNNNTEIEVVGVTYHD